MSLDELQFSLWKVVTNNVLGTICAIWPLLISRAILLGAPAYKDNGGFYLGLIYGGMVFWNLGVLAAWFWVRSINQTDKAQNKS